MQLSMDIAPPYLPMDKLAQVKLILWLENKKYFIAKFTNQIQAKVLFLVLFNSFGKKLNPEKSLTPLKQVTHNFITNKSKIY